MRVSECFLEKSAHLNGLVLPQCVGRSRTHCHLSVTKSERQQRQVLWSAVGCYDLKGGEAYARIMIPDCQWKECVRHSRIASTRLANQKAPHSSRTIAKDGYKYLF